jgi:hypothetical protein
MVSVKWKCKPKNVPEAVEEEIDECQEILQLA